MGTGAKTGRVVQRLTGYLSIDGRTMGDSIYLMDDGTLVTGPLDLDRDMGICRTMYIPASHVEEICRNLEDGVNWAECSPVYPITREIADYILTHSG